MEQKHNGVLSESSVEAAVRTVGLITVVSSLLPGTVSALFYSFAIW